jgi:hypothetical protein
MDIYAAEQTKEAKKKFSTCLESDETELWKGQKKTHVGIESNVRSSSF